MKKTRVLPSLQAHGSTFDLLDITEDLMRKHSLVTYVNLTRAQRQLVLLARVRPDTVDLLHSVTAHLCGAVLFVRGTYIAFKGVPSEAEMQAAFPDLLGPVYCDQCGRGTGDNASLCVVCKTTLCPICRPDSANGIRCAVCAGEVAKVICRYMIGCRVWGPPR